MRQHLLVRRAAAHRHRGQQRGLEPAAMLVRTFQIDIGLRREAIGIERFRNHRLEHALMRDAGIEPHRSEEHTSELQSLMRISYAVFCLKQNTYTMSRLLHRRTIDKSDMHASKLKVH